MSSIVSSIVPGRIKFFNIEKGFGFIIQTDGPDIFFHKSALITDPSQCIEGAEVSYIVGQGAKGPAALNVSVTSAPLAAAVSPPKLAASVPRAAEGPSSRGPELNELIGIMRNRVARPGDKLTFWARMLINDYHGVKDIKNEDGSFTQNPYTLGSHIPSLATIALPEIWCFSYDIDKHSILKNYIRYTFYKLAKEGKVAFSGQYATFNTGLVDNLYEPIYGLFRRRKGNEEARDKRPYEFVDWCVISGRGKSAQELRKEFSVRPDAPTYFTQIGDVIFNDKHELITQWEHVLEDAITRGRFPLNFLHAYTPKGFSWDDDLDPKTQLKQFADCLQVDTQCRRQMKNRMDDAIQVAKKRASWNYKTAIPSYYPTRNEMNILLPLALTDDNVVDLALVVKRINEREYYGSTVYPLDMAYKGARLVCRPDSDWLRPDIKEQSRILDDDDEEE
jgi:cold shock CspA family protein